MKILKTFGIIALCFLFCFSICGCAKEEIKKVTYELHEIEDNAYGIYYQTHSRAPAYNYDVITINCGGRVRTFKGTVNIIYSSDNPRAEIEPSNYVNCDRVTVYIPNKGIKFANDVDIK